MKIPRLLFSLEKRGTPSTPLFLSREEMWWPRMENWACGRGRKKMRMSVTLACMKGWMGWNIAGSLKHLFYQGDCVECWRKFSHFFNHPILTTHIVSFLPLCFSFVGRNFISFHFCRNAQVFISKCWKWWNCGIFCYLVCHHTLIHSFPWRIEVQNQIKEASFETL